MKKLKPYFTQANKSMKGKPEKFGLAIEQADSK